MQSSFLWSYFSSDDEYYPFLMNVWHVTAHSLPFSGFLFTLHLLTLPVGDRLAAITTQHAEANAQRAADVAQRTADAAQRTAEYHEAARKRTADQNLALIAHGHTRDPHTGQLIPPVLPTSPSEAPISGIHLDKCMVVWLLVSRCSNTV
jgi:hypothetical protein